VTEDAMPSAVGATVASPAAVDARLLVPAATVWLAAFVSTGSPPAFAPGWVVLTGCFGVGALALLMSTALAGRAPIAAGERRNRRRLLALGLLGLLGGGVVGATHLQAVRGSGLADLARKQATMTGSGIVTADPVWHPGGTRGGDHRVAGFVTVEVRLDTVVARGQRWRVRAPVLLLASDRRWRRLLPSQHVRLQGRLESAEPGQPLAAVVDVRGPPALRGRPTRVQRSAGSLRAGLRAASAGLPGDERGLLPGLVVGDTSRVPADLVTAMRATGLTHLVAVSGANLAIVVGAGLVAARWSGVRGRGLPVVGVLALAGFVVLARPQPSVVRAAAMAGLALAAVITGRSRQGVSALLGAVLVLVLVDPWLTRSFGFALSVAATAGLLVVAPGWARAWHRRGVPRALAELLAVPLAAQLLCAPLVVLLSGRVSLVAVPANLLAAPAVAPATVLGVLATVVHPLDATVARWLAGLASVPVWWIAQVARRSAAVPGGSLPWPGTAAGAVLLGLLTIGGVIAVPWLARRPAAAAGTVAVLGVALVVPATSPGWPPDGWVMAACDVGQGDALVLAVAPGTAVVVDAGPDPAAVDSCLHGLGVRRVPLVLLTHLHADHVEGLPGVLHGRSVGEVAWDGYAEPAGELVRVRHWVQADGLRLDRVGVGDRMSVGPVHWQVLWPARVIHEGSVPNNASLVLLVRSHGLRLLLTGDVEPPAQAALLARSDLGPVDVLKVPHHGSAHQDPDLLATVRPRLALVSVGVDNDYGHPAPVTLRAIHREGAVLGRTDRDGTLAVVGDRSHLRLVTRR
jgi:competence protein ComEC